VHFNVCVMEPDKCPINVTLRMSRERCSAEKAAGRSDCSDAEGVTNALTKLPYTDLEP
jgi:hypothetical protein